MNRLRLSIFVILLSLAAFAQNAPANYPAPQQADFVIRDFQFSTGEKLPEVRIHYRTIGTLKKNADGSTNLVLILHGTTGAGTQFLNPVFANELFGPGQPLDSAKYFLVLPDNLGHGQSTKPSDGLHARFPKYGYNDMVAAQHRLLTEGLGVQHARLIMGTSMGGMHSWMWAEKYPAFADAYMPLASLPVQIAGRNRMWRKIVIDAIRNSPDYNGGDYTQQPSGRAVAVEMLALMGSNPVQRQKDFPTLQAADKYLEEQVANNKLDANDILYAVQASWDYDPSRDLEKITAPLLAVNTKDDLINPGELGILEREITRVKTGKAVHLPLSDETRGHGSHTIAKLWKQYLVELLARTEHK